MKQMELDAVPALALSGGGTPHCLATPGPLRPTGVEILDERDRDEVWQIAVGGGVRLWWKRAVVPAWRRPFSALTRSRSRREACGLELLRQRGLPAPRVCACMEWRRRRVLKESALITYDLPGARTLGEFLREEASAPRRAEACAAVGRLAARLHLSGLGHFRLFAKNVMVHPAEPSRVWVLDAPYLCAWEGPPPAPVRRFDLATLCSRAGDLDLVQSGIVLQEYARHTGCRWDERRLVGAPRWRLKLRRISLYLAAIWRGHRAERYVVLPPAPA